ncbi:MAG: hypothetical protein ACLP1X_12690 [Polyangiaceae bacterium]|jgi:hypothetical protein
MKRISSAKALRTIAGAVLAASAGLLACSAPSSNGFGGGASTGTGATSNQASSSGTSSGASTSGGGSGPSQSGPSGVGGSSGGSTTVTADGGGGSGSPGGGSSGGSSGGGADGGTASDGIPTAPGITAGPTGATDLAAPPASVGMQFATVAGAYQVAPGDEIFPNFCVTVPNNIQVGGFQSWMSEGSSHHFILYKGGTAPADGSCTLGANDWMYASSTPGQVITENFPANVGLSITANTQLILNMHFINPTANTLTPQIKVNLLYAQDVKYQAGTMVSFNTSIDIPPETAAGPGTQTVSGTCTAPVGANFFTMSTHTHDHATAAWVDYVHDGTSTEIVHTGTETTYPADQEPGSGVDWQHPGVGLWTAPNFLTVQAGDSFTYHCSYTNTSTSAVTVGETACCNEMCMAVGYYYPAGSASCN